jgi:hypothetical protein
VFLAWLACVLRHVINPELWLQYTPGRWLAFAWATARVESNYKANAVNATSGAKGLFQYVESNVKALGVDPWSPWSQGWHAPELLAQSCDSFTWWLRLFIPGGTRMRALWHYGPADSDGISKAAKEKTFHKQYWIARLVGLIIDLPYLFLLPLGLVLLIRWRKRQKRSQG